jgi:hypothetical protein
MIKVSKNPLERNSYIISKGLDYKVEDWLELKEWLEQQDHFYLNGGVLHFKSDEISMMFALKYL